MAYKAHEKVAFLPTTNFSCPGTYFLLAGPISPKLIPVSSDLGYTQLGQTLHWASSPPSNIYLLSTYKVPDTSGDEAGRGFTLFSKSLLSGLSGRYKE